MKTFYQRLANTVLANVTNMTVWFALIFFVYLETKSVTATSIISGVYLVLTASLGIWFGSLVDHNKKKKVMILSGVISLSIYIMGFIIYLSYPDERSHRRCRQSDAPGSWQLTPRGGTHRKIHAKPQRNKEAKALEATALRRRASKPCEWRCAPRVHSLRFFASLRLCVKTFARTIARWETTNVK